jgi:hypothetical protein
MGKFIARTLRLAVVAGVLTLGAKFLARTDYPSRVLQAGRGYYDRLRERL